MARSAIANGDTGQPNLMKKFEVTYLSSGSTQSIFVVLVGSGEDDSTAVARCKAEKDVVQIIKIQYLGLADPNSASPAIGVEE